VGSCVIAIWFAIHPDAVMRANAWVKNHADYNIEYPKDFLDGVIMTEKMWTAMTKELESSDLNVQMCICIEQTAGGFGNVCCKFGLGPLLWLHSPCTNAPSRQEYPKHFYWPLLPT
jgi:hypothetical protein